jgi:hypothetical protein
MLQSGNMVHFSLEVFHSWFNVIWLCNAVWWLTVSTMFNLNTKKIHNCRVQCFITPLLNLLHFHGTTPWYLHRHYSASAYIFHFAGPSSKYLLSLLRAPGLGHKPWRHPWICQVSKLSRNRGPKYEVCYNFDYKVIQILKILTNALIMYLTFHLITQNKLSNISEWQFRLQPFQIRKSDHINRGT